MTDSIPFLVCGSTQIGDNETAEVESVLRTDWLGTGSRTSRFESKFAEYKSALASFAAPEHPVYRASSGWTPERWPHAARIGRQAVSPPIHPRLGDADVQRVINAVREMFQDR